MKIQFQSRYKRQSYPPGYFIIQVKVNYCRFGFFRENFIFAISIEIHIIDVKNSRLRQDLPISINDRVILLFRECFIFTKLCICEVSRK